MSHVLSTPVEIDQSSPPSSASSASAVCVPVAVAPAVAAAVALVAEDVAADVFAVEAPIADAFVPAAAVVLPAVEAPEAVPSASLLRHEKYNGKFDSGKYSQFLM